MEPISKCVMYLESLLWLLYLLSSVEFVKAVKSIDLEARHMYLLSVLWPQVSYSTLLGFIFFKWKIGIILSMS